MASKTQSNFRAQTSYIWFRILLPIVALLVTLVFLYQCRMIDAPDKLFSTSNHYRLQVQAFLRGNLVLQDNPYMHEHDWNFSPQGMFQNWGMGIPLLMLIPQVILSQLGMPILSEVLFYSFFILNYVFLWLFVSCRLYFQRPLGSAVIAIMGLFILFFTRPFFAIFGSRFLVYEQAVGLEMILGMGQVLFLLLSVTERKMKWAWMASCLAAVGILVRPTGLFHALVTGSVLAYFTFQDGKDFPKKFKKIALKFLLLQSPITVGFLSLLGINFLKFGRFFEFGYPFCLSGSPIDIYALRFDFPYSSETIYLAARELVGWLFFNGDPEWYSPVFRARWRELVSYNPIFIPCLLLSLSVGVSTLLKGRDIRMIRCVQVLFFWGVFDFTIHFGFYLRTHGIAPRYMLDFYPAISSLLLIPIVTFRISHFASYPPLFLLLWGVSCFSANSLGYQNGPSLVSFDTVLHDMEHRQPLIHNPLASNLLPRYECGDPIFKTRFRLPPIPYNLMGWDALQSCRTSYAVQAFLPRSECYRFELDETKRNSEFQEIRMRRNGVGLNLRSSKRINQSYSGFPIVVREYTYCSKIDPKTDGDGHFSLITLGLIKRPYLGILNRENFPVLRSISIAESSDDKNIENFSPAEATQKSPEN